MLALSGIFSLILCSFVIDCTVKVYFITTCEKISLDLQQTIAKEYASHNGHFLHWQQSLKLNSTLLYHNYLCECSHLFVPFNPLPHNL